jgi:hypothetical protein
LIATPCAVAIVWMVDSGLLPTGLSLNSFTGEISGTPTGESASYGFVISVTGSGFSCNKTYTLTVNACTNITTASPIPDADEGVAYSQQLNSIVIVSPVWSIIAGALPAGLNLSAGGLISGTPTVNGGFNFTAKVTGDNGTCGKEFALTVNPSGPPPCVVDCAGAGSTPGTLVWVVTEVPDPGLVSVTALGASGTVALSDSVGGAGASAATGIIDTSFCNNTNADVTLLLTFTIDWSISATCVIGQSSQVGINIRVFPVPIFFQKDIVQFNEIANHTDSGTAEIVLCPFVCPACSVTALQLQMAGGLTSGIGCSASYSMSGTFAVTVV